MINENCTPNYQKYTLSLFIFSAVYILFFLFIDKPIAYSLKPLTEAPLSQKLELFSNIANYKIWAAMSFIMFATAAVFLWRGFRFSTGFRKGLYVLSSVFLAIVIGAGLKFVLARYRPELLFQDNLYGFHFFSFNDSYSSSPSGHTLVIFAVCTALSMLFRRYAILFLALALFIGASRIILEEHYLSDVLLGAYIGILSALLCAELPIFKKVILRTRQIKTH